MKNKIVIDDNSVTLDKFLKNSYSNLWESIQKEQYNLDFLDFNEFYEITHEDNVVGFIAVENFISSGIKLIVDCYILPDARGNKLLYEYLIDIMADTCVRVFYRKPTVSFIQAINSYGLTYKIGGDLLFTWVDFIVTLKDAYKNSKIKRLYKSLDEENESNFSFSRLFDLNFKCLLFKENMGLFSKDKDTFIIAEPRKYDIKKYSSRRKLKKVTVRYLDEIKQQMANNAADAFKYFRNLDIKLSEHFTVDNMIGSDAELKDDVVSILKDNDLTLEDGFKIRQSIADAVESGDILNISIKDRFSFLIEKNEFIGKTVDDGEESFYKCPFCGEYKSAVLYSCIHCGHDFGEEVIGQSMVDEFDLTEEELSDIDGYFEKKNMTLSNTDFLIQFNDFNRKLNDILGGNIKEFLQGIDKLDYKIIDELTANEMDADKFDWHFKDDCDVDNYLLRKIEENNYDFKEVFDAQSRIFLYESVKFTKDNIITWKSDFIHDNNHIHMDALTQALDKGFIQKFTGDEFTTYLEGYSKQELEEELEYFGIEPKTSKKEIIGQIAEQGDILFDVTDEGLKYLNSNPLLKFFADNMEEYLFFEFEMFYNENKDDYTIEEIANRFVNENFKKSIKSGNLDDYLKYLEYYFKINFNNKNYDEAVYYLIQRVIYEVNKWYLAENHHNFDFAISIKTGKYFQDMSKVDKIENLKEIMDKAFNEFKFPHMKDNKILIDGFCLGLISGIPFMVFNELLLSDGMD